MNYRPLPLFASHVPCGFPSPADDYIETSLDLNELVIAHPEATFYVRVSGDSMINAAIFDGDIVVIDRARKAEQNSIVLALLNEEFTVKRLRKQGAPASSLFQSCQRFTLVVSTCRDPSCACSAAFWMSFLEVGQVHGPPRHTSASRNPPMCR